MITLVVTTSIQPLIIIALDYVGLFSREHRNKNVSTEISW